MSIHARLLPSSGGLETIDTAKNWSSLDQATHFLPQGAYTTFRTFERTKAIRLSEHFDRLEHTAALTGSACQVDRPRIRKALHELALLQSDETLPSNELRFRIILDLTSHIGDVYLLTEPLHTPSDADYLHGVKVVSRVMHRSNPKAKMTSFIETAASVRETLPAGINEAAMIDAEGRILEGLSSNFFAILDGVVWTAEKGVLAGITRAVILDILSSMKVQVVFQGIALQDMPRVQEAFISSASRAVLPVTTFDANPVGEGVPGKMTNRILQQYQQNINQELEAF